MKLKIVAVVIASAVVLQEAVTAYNTRRLQSNTQCEKNNTLAR